MTLTTRTLVLAMLALLAAAPVFAQKEKAATHCLTAEEQRLATLINEYRRQQGLPAVPVSRALSFTAHAHVVDLQDKVGRLTHGWSDCDYDKGGTKAYQDCMWDKPKQLAGYPSDGFECAHGGSGGYVANAQTALDGWKKSKYHNMVIVNTDMWKDFRWQAMGVGVYGGYAVVWFGASADELGTPDVCR